MSSKSENQGASSIRAKSLASHEHLEAKRIELGLEPSAPPPDLSETVTALKEARPSTYSGSMRAIYSLCWSTRIHEHFEPDARGELYKQAAGVAQQIAKENNLPDTPAPLRDKQPKVDTALRYLERCYDAFLDRESPLYWKWRYSDARVAGGNRFLVWHLDNMILSWQLHTGGHPPQNRRDTLRVLDGAETEFAAFHEHWVLPECHTYVDYLPVCTALCKIVADVLPDRPTEPAGYFSIANLAGYINQLRGALGLVPSTTRRRHPARTSPPARFVEQALEAAKLAGTWIARDNLLSAMRGYNVGGRYYAWLTQMANEGLLISGQRGFIHPDCA